MNHNNGFKDLVEGYNGALVDVPRCRKSWTRPQYMSVTISCFCDVKTWTILCISMRAQGLRIIKF